MKNKFYFMLLLLTLYGGASIYSQREGSYNDELEKLFSNPPDSVRPWVFWDWISGNVRREGITKDLEALKSVGIGGVVWRGIGSTWWAPEGEATPYTPKFDSLMYWSIQEAERLGLEFSISQDFGYGSGGPHITPDISMQEICWSQTIVDGEGKVDIILEKPEVSKGNVEKAWLRPGNKLAKNILNDIERIDSYNDIAIIAIPLSNDEKSFRIPQLDLRTGMGTKTYFLKAENYCSPLGGDIPQKEIIDLTSRANSEGRLIWNAPPGEWQIIRIGYASNYRMTRPCPTDAVGLECNRMSRRAIEVHFKHFLEPILKATEIRTGTTITNLFLDSWEAGCQNWTEDFEKDFYKLKEYDLASWLPVLTGRVVESVEMSERFLWDFRQIISDMILENYHQKLRELIAPYGLNFSVEAYGNLCINTLRYADLADFPLSEFWTMGDDKFPSLKPQEYYNSMKVMASAAHATGKIHVGAEAFTGNRGWKDHPYIYKGVGDEAFAQGVNHFILHLSAHQAYEDMVPGLTHQKWGGHFNRHNTWWNYSHPWLEYIARSQYLLKQGQFIADVCYFFGEGAPLDIKDMNLDLPSGYDYDICSSDILQKMEVNNGKIVLPSGMSYRYLLLPNTEKLTFPSMQKIDKLAKSGAKIIAQKRIVGTPGLSNFPEEDQKVRASANKLWNQGKIITETDWEKIFEEDNVQPDFKGAGLNYIHRKIDDIDIYFVANPKPEVVRTLCSFRVSRKVPELWNPETGEIRKLPEFKENNGQVSVPLYFNPMQSWFIIFRKKSSLPESKVNFSRYKSVLEIEGKWQVHFDSQWGGPSNLVVFETLQDWSKHTDAGIKYYSGTATYKKRFNLSKNLISDPGSILLDLGKVEVMARVRVNGKDCGVVWKPPYRIDISNAIQTGENILEIDVVNTWVNRMIGDEQLLEDCEWIDWIRLREWPEWFLKNTQRPTKRYTFTTVKHYEKDDPLILSGLLGPVRIIKCVE